ncbi:MAG: glycoside hydrolase family 32 protein, partial [Halobaculum sp.]
GGESPSAAPSGSDGSHGAALLYESDDLREWTYVGPLLTGVGPRGAPVWECPELLRFGDDGCLLHVSDDDRVAFFSGYADLDEPSFHVAERGLLDYGDFYAPQSLWDEEQNRYVTWGWLPEARTAAAQWEAGWSGLLSLPRVVSPGDGRIRQRPATEVTDLRDRRLAETTTTLAAGDYERLARGRGVEVTATVDLHDAAEAGVVVSESAAGAERTPIRYDGETVTVDRRASSASDTTVGEPLRMPVDSDGPLELRAFVDGSVVELFADEHRCLTARIYPEDEDADRLSLYALDGSASLDVTVWSLASTWETRTGR